MRSLILSIVIVLLALDSSAAQPLDGGWECRISWESEKIELNGTFSVDLESSESDSYDGKWQGKFSLEAEEGKTEVEAAGAASLVVIASEDGSDDSAYFSADPKWIAIRDCSGPRCADEDDLIFDLAFCLDLSAAERKDELVVTRPTRIDLTDLGKTTESSLTCLRRSEG